MSEPACKGRIAICIPSGRAFEARMAISLSLIVASASAHGYEIVIINESGSTVSFARNCLVEQALQFKPDWIFFLDTDITFRSPDILVRLIAHDRDIVGATYSKRTPPHFPLGGFLDPELDLSAGGLVEARFMPGGVMLIRASVFETLGYPWFFEKYKWSADSLMLSFMKMLEDWSLVEMPADVRSALLSCPGLAPWLEANEAADMAAFGPSVITSEDYSFCLKVRKAGFQIWCDLDVTHDTAHVGEQFIFCPPAHAPDVFAWLRRDAPDAGSR